MDVIREGTMTRRPVPLWEKGNAKKVTSSAFLDAIAEKLV